MGMKTLVIIFALVATIHAKPNFVKTRTKRAADSRPIDLTNWSIDSNPISDFNYDTEFTTNSKALLEELDMYNIRLKIRDESLNSATFETITWTQYKRCGLFTSCSESYRLVEYYQDGNRNRIFKVFVHADTTPPESFQTSGYKKQEGDELHQLHFGYLWLTAGDAAVFFVIHPNEFGPYAHNFKTDTLTEWGLNTLTGVNGAVGGGLGTAAGGLVGAQVGAQVGATLGSIVPVTGTTIGGIIGAVGGVIGGAAATLTDDYVGEYLRYIG